LSKWAAGESIAPGRPDDGEVAAFGKMEVLETVPERRLGESRLGREPIRPQQ
jgi:hypothetical protein